MNWFTFSILNSFVGILIGTCSTSGCSLKLMASLYQSLHSSVPAQITTGLLPNAIAACGTKLSIAKTGYLPAKHIIILKSQVRY